MKTSDFGYILPKELIAQEPCAKRDACKMLVLDKSNGEVQDKHFYDIVDFVKPGDLLVANETRVLPARLLGVKRDTGGEAELLLLKNLGDDQWEALVKPGRRLKPASLAENLGTTKSASCGGKGPIVDFSDDNNEVILSAEIIDWGSSEGARIVKLSSDVYDIGKAIHKVGATPLPPYIHGYTGNMEMYQTVYSVNETSAAAPTAGLHFTEELIARLRERGIGWATVELEVGIDTFKPVTEDDPKDHQMHTEMRSISQETIDRINETKAKGGRVIAVGTTSVRTLESAWDESTGSLKPVDREPTNLFILPGYNFKCVDALITNFHVPESTLMMLVTAFGGYDNVMNAYAHAVESKYRFLSFGDAMFIK